MNINWKKDRITRQFIEAHAAELSNISSMTPFQLCEASTYCADWQNPFTEELVKRAGSYSRYQEARCRSVRIKIIQNAAESFGHVLL